MKRKTDMKISITTRYKPDKFKFKEFYDKRIHFNRVHILDSKLINELVDNRPMHWAAIEMFNKVWGGIDINTEVNQVAQVIKCTMCGELINTVFLVYNHNQDRLIINLSGVNGNTVPIEIFIAYIGSQETFDIYMNELNIEVGDYKMIHDYIKNS